ncbi:MAG: cell division protein ZapD [Candidatus Methylumidiphilus sp.]
MNDLVLYEFPLNERIRVFMRLEQLFEQIDHFLKGSSIWESRAVIATLLEILTIFSRNDLKSEILKEVDRHTNVLNKMGSSQRIDRPKLDTILAKLNAIGDELYSTPGKIGYSLMENELFKCISQRSSIPGGTCAFDLPAYHHWLQQQETRRKQDLEEWLTPFQTIRAAVDLLLNFIRQSAAPTQEQCQGGFYHKTLDHSLPFQLLRVGLSRSQPYFAEISGGKHRFTIRFMVSNASERPTQTDEDVGFQLTCCIL